MVKFQPIACSANLLRLTGRGVKIVLIDSGINWSQALQGTDAWEACSFTNLDPFVDKIGHGTTSHSLLFGTGTNPKRVPICPEASLFLAQVVDEEGKVPESAVVQALQWAHSISPDVVSIPYGKKRPKPSLSNAIERLVACGAVVLAPAGNPFSGQRRSLFPGSHPGTISVGCEAYLDLYMKWKHGPDLVMRTEKLVTEPGLAQSTSTATLLATGFISLLIQLARRDDLKRRREWFIRMLTAYGLAVSGENQVTVKPED